MTMPCPLGGRTKLSHRIWYFFIWSFVAAHITSSNSEWGYRGFLWTKGTPKYIPRNRAALVNISREQGNKPNFGGSESGNLENPFLCIGHTHSLIVILSIMFSWKNKEILFIWIFIFSGAMRIALCAGRSKQTQLTYSQLTTSFNYS